MSLALREIQAQTDGGGVGVLRLADARVVDVHADDIRGFDVAGGLEQQRLVRVGGQERTAGEN